MIGFGISDGVLAGSLAGGLIGTNSGDTEAPSLEPVPITLLPEVRSTLDPTQAPQLGRKRASLPRADRPNRDLAQPQGTRRYRQHLVARVTVSPVSRA